MPALSRVIPTQEHSNHMIQPSGWLSGRTYWIDKEKRSKQHNN